jgi:hypothetical protein
MSQSAANDSRLPVWVKTRLPLEQAVPHGFRLKFANKTQGAVFWKAWKDVSYRLFSTMQRDR